MKRLVAWLMTLMLMFGAMTTAAVADDTTGSTAGDKYVPTNSYIFEFNAEDNNGYNNGIYCYAEFSKFVPKISYDGGTVDGYSIIFGLYDSYHNKTFQNLYCTDLPVDATKSDYRPINLSDSTYAAGVANKLRGILRHTYPYISVDDLAKESGVTGLTRGEAITGSQLAIWQTAHGDNMVITDFVAFTGGNSGPGEIQKELDDEGTAYSNGDAAYKAAVKGRIEALYNYLMGLPEEQAKKKVVSESAFISKTTDPEFTQNTDGTYSVSVTAKVDVDMTGENDNLTLTAYVGEGNPYVQKKMTDGEQEYELTISGIPEALADSTVMLAIDGVQDFDDVYLVDARGIRGASQSMIGVLSGDFPVHADVKAEKDRVFNLIKQEKGTEKPIAGISFDVYWVGSLEDYMDGKLDIGEKPSESDISTYAKSTKLVGTLTTDKKGEASLNFGTEDGVYLIKELPSDAVVAPVEPFFIILPDAYHEDDDGSTPAYSLTAKPKNVLNTEKPKIEKDVTSINNQHDTFAVGEEHTWIIRTSIPESIRTAKKYVITDTLDYRLDYKKLDKVVLVKVSDSSEAATLVADTDYTLMTEKVTSGGKTVDKMTVSLTNAGMSKIATAVGSDNAGYELRTYMVATINTNAEMGKNIENGANLTFTNSSDKTYEVKSEHPEVHTGGVLLKKVDSRDQTKVLAGATFEVYRKATEAEIANNNITKTELKVDNDGTTETVKMVQVDFYSSTEMSGNKVQTVTTGENGTAVIYGLAYGDYYLWETVAPEGYNKPAKALKVTVNGSSHTENGAVTVTNGSGVELPSTGGVGTTAFTMGGLALIGLAVLLLLRRRVYGR